MQSNQIYVKKFPRMFLDTTHAAFGPSREGRNKNMLRLVSSPPHCFSHYKSCLNTCDFLSSTAALEHYRFVKNLTVSAVMAATTLRGVSCSFMGDSKSRLGGPKRRPATPSHSREWCCREREDEEGDMQGKRKAMVITEEKAKWLRRQLRATEIGTDGMYHSAIASRLAFSDDEDGVS